MVTGLFKSSFLHLAIVLIFLYGAEIFKRNKRFEIVEIPLDIVEISEKTVTKKNIPKAQQKPKKSQSYTPPEVLSRPKNPEFTKKKKVIKKEKEKENQQEKLKEKSKAESILKSIEKIKSQTVKKDKEIKKEDEKISEDKVTNLGEKLTISEKDAIRRQFYSCWIVPAGAKNIKDYKVSIKLRLDTNGEVTSSNLTNSLKNADPFYRTLAESAVRAVNHPDCKKLKVPKRKYDTWKEMILDFDPSLMIN
tara:strand:- start:135 stop:881 length:747 start_codon:yes stop_codon:yes gene_type:complete